MNSLYALFALDMLNLAVFLPVFSACVRSLGGTPFTIGLINSSSALISLLWNPIVGSLSDQVGRKGLLIKCLLASSLGSIILAGSSSLFFIFIGRLIGSLGSPVGILLRSIVADTCKTADDKKSFLNKSAPVMSVAFLVGSLSSGFLSEAKHGYSLAFLLMATIMGVATTLATSLASDTKENKSNSTDNPSLIKKGLQELKKAALDIKGISWPRYKNLFIVKASYDFSLAMIMTNLGFILLDEFNIQGRYMAYVFLMVGILSIISNIVKLKLKSLFDSITDQEMLTKGGLILITSFIGMSIPGPLFVFLFFFCVMCVGRAFLDTTLTEMVTTETTEEDRGKVIGAYENLMMLSAFIAPLFCGLVAEAFGDRIVVISAVIPMLISVLVANRQRTKTE